MKSIDKYIKEKFSLLDMFEQNDFIIEGININDKSKTVSLTDKHSSGVDFNLVNSPIYYFYCEFFKQIYILCLLLNIIIY